MTKKLLPTSVRRARLLSAAVAGAAALFMAAGSAQAQDGPSTGPRSSTDETAQPRTSSPFWGGDGYDDQRRDRRDRYDDDNGTFAENFPLDLAGLVAPARERYVGMKYSYELARDRLSDRTAELRRSFEDSEEYRSLRQEMDEVQSAIRASREQALAPLMDDPQYEALLELQATVEAQIRAAHRAPEPDLEKIRGMSELALAYARQRREMEAGLVGTDSSIQSSQDRLREMADRQNEMEAEYQRQVRNDEELGVMRDEIEQFRVAYLSAGAYYDSVVRSADIAADFAYYNALARAGASFGGGGYSPYGYSYPYGGGFYGGGRFGGVVVGGLPGVFPPGDGPIRLRPVLYPTPILSHTFRGINQATNFQPGAPGGSPPEIPTPEE